MGKFDINKIRRHLPHYRKVCVETGTFKGDGTAVMAKHFDHVYTIELNEELFNKAVRRFRNTKNVTCLLGDSKVVLRDLIPNLPPSGATFFLDAHWSGDETVDWANSEFRNSTPTSYTGDEPTSENQVPLKEELELITKLYPGSALIYIDDMDKFDKHGRGTKNLKFQGEDWSHLTVKTLRKVVQPRLFNWYFPDPGQLIIELKGR